MKRRIPIEGDVVDVLRVPYYSQSDMDAYCIPFSLKMCLTYFRDIYDNPVIKKQTPNFDVNEIVGITSAHRYNGTRISDDLMNKLSKNIPSIEFKLKSIDYREIEKNLRDNIPVIVLYNCTYMLYDEVGPGHAGVVIGLTNDKIILNNPWLGPDKIIDKREFNVAWELEYNSAIIMKPNPQSKLLN